MSVLSKLRNHPCHNSLDHRRNLDLQIQNPEFLVWHRLNRECESRIRECEAARSAPMLSLTRFIFISSLKSFLEIDHYTFLPTTTENLTKLVKTIDLAST
eukprot:GHVP01001913.1.p1 GENE.GHVP01001913.1~~GHVP01001913.1.p1  ORF type:complete len:100 (+),score=6.71 GHVP01001913.1:28-327(+)